MLPAQFHPIFIIVLAIQIIIHFPLALLSAINPSSAPQSHLHEYLSDRSDQILLNRLYSPIFAAPAPIYNVQTSLYEFPSSVTLTVVNASLGVSTTTTGQLRCNYYPIIPQTASRKASSTSTDLSQILHPISLLVTPYILQPPRFPYTAEYNPTQIGQYSPGFLSSSSPLYNYLNGEEINEVLISPDYNPSESFPWDILEVILERPQKIHRKLQFDFAIDPEALLSTHPSNRQQPPLTRQTAANPQNQHQFVLPPHNSGYVQCVNMMISTDIPSVQNRFSAHIFTKDATKNTILYATSLVLGHSSLEFDYQHKTLSQAFNITINIEDLPDFNSSQIRPTSPNANLHAQTPTKTAAQYYSYLHDIHRLEIELYLPFIKYANSMDHVITDVEILRDRTVYRDIVSKEHDQAIFDRSDTHFELSLRHQCTQQSTGTTTATIGTSLNSKESQCRDNEEIGKVGARTFILNAEITPTISSITAVITYTFTYAELVKYLTWETVATKSITPSTLRYYDILALNGFPTHSHTDFFDLLKNKYLAAAHFYSYQNFTVSHPSPLPATPNSNPLFGFEIPHNVKRDQAVIPNIFTQTGLNLESAPLTRAFPIPDILTRSMSPQLQGLFFKKLRALELTTPQINSLRSTQIVEWGIQLPNTSLCPTISTDDFNAVDDVSGFPRIKIILWFDCILST